MAKGRLGCVAYEILTLTYAEMMSLADDLSRAIAEKDVWPDGCTTPEHFAVLLSGWAEANGDDG